MQLDFFFELRILYQSISSFGRLQFCKDFSLTYSLYFFDVYEWLYKIRMV